MQSKVRNNGGRQVQRGECRDRQAEMEEGVSRQGVWKKSYRGNDTDRGGSKVRERKLGAGVGKDTQGVNDDQGRRQNYKQGWRKIRYDNRNWGEGRDKSRSGAGTGG